MTRIAKLNERFLGGGRLSFAELEVLLGAYGFRLMRIRGSHRIYVCDDIPDQLSVQPLGKEAKPYQVRQFRHIIAQHDLSLDDR